MLYVLEMLVNSMHKYRPEIFIVRVYDFPRQSPIVASESFEETEFVTVTSYHNHKIAQLKINYNPFSYGFRECSIHEEKRQCRSFTEGEETVEREGGR